LQFDLKIGPAHRFPLLEMSKDFAAENSVRVSLETTVRSFSVVPEPMALQGGRTMLKASGTRKITSHLFSNPVDLVGPRMGCQK
jgi:hypothetical protein